MTDQFINAINRRTFLKGSSYSVGSAALAYLLSQEAQAAPRWKGVLNEKLHFPPKAKRVIHLCMAGGPSHLETLDHKPELAKQLHYVFIWSLMYRTNQIIQNVLINV